MIGAVVLATGLLLILAGLASARIPGGATFAQPGIPRSPIRAFALSPIHPATWSANGALALGLFVGVFGFAFVASVTSAGLTVLLAGIGVVFVALAMEGARLIARIERWRAFAGEPSRPAPHPYRPLRGGPVGVLRAEFADENRWRDVLYVAINLPLAVIEFAVVAVFWLAALWLLTMPAWYDPVADAWLAGLLGPLSGQDAPTVVLRTLLGLALLPVAASLSQIVMVLHRAVVAGLLCTSESRELRRQVETLRQSRSAVLDVEASELHRIERDLHDGAQQRLVMLTIDLGLASEKLDTDPAAARALILAGQQEAGLALAEIRSLVRGIAPSILLDRGLVAALESITGRGPVATTVLSELAPGERFPAAVERAAYFVAAEALANVAKHSGATRCEVRCGRSGSGSGSGSGYGSGSGSGSGSSLVVEVVDDGAGGARVEPGGGLAGLASRVAGVDGTFSVSSPAGGPTVVRAEIPIRGADGG